MKPLSVAFIKGKWHDNIVSSAERGFLEYMKKHPHFSVKTFTVPGSLEIPVFAKQCFNSGNFDAVVGAGFVVDGGIYCHEFVETAIINGFMQLMLETGKPVFSVVLTPKTFQENAPQLEFFEKHFVQKGEEAAQACVEYFAECEKI